MVKETLEYTLLPVSSPQQDQDNSPGNHTNNINDIERIERGKPNYIDNPIVISSFKESFSHNVIPKPKRFHERVFSIVSDVCIQCADINVNIDSKHTMMKKSFFVSAEVIFSFVYHWYWQFIVHDPFCSWLFRCGCVVIWNGGWNNCNYWRNINNGGPRCPWCMARRNISWTTDYLIYALMMVVFLAALYYRKKSVYTYAVVWRWTLPMASYFLFGIIVGVIFKIATGYPYFIFI